MVGSLYGFFGHVVLPRYGGRLYDDAGRRERIRLRWLVSSNGYGLVLLAGVVLLYSALGLSTGP